MQLQKRSLCICKQLESSSLCSFRGVQPMQCVVAILLAHRSSRALETPSSATAHTGADAALAVAWCPTAGADAIAVACSDATVQVRAAYPAVMPAQYVSVHV